MGLLELAAAMKFLSNVDLVWGWGIFTRPVVLVVVDGDRARAGRLSRGPHPARPRAASGAPGRRALDRRRAPASSLGVWLASGLTGRRLGELEAFLPPADLAGRTPDGELPWIVNDYDAALARGARAEPRAS